MYTAVYKYVFENSTQNRSVTVVDFDEHFGDVLPYDTTKNDKKST